RYLDVGCGTGNYSIAIREAGFAIWGVDMSATMLERACAKSRAGPWLKADALALPFRDGSFAGATMTFVHHHLADPVTAFRQIRRVLAPGGRFVLLNGTLNQFNHYWLLEYFPLAMERAFAPYVRLETDD